MAQHDCKVGSSGASAVDVCWFVFGVGLRLHVSSLGFSSRDRQICFISRIKMLLEIKVCGRGQTRLNLA